MSSILTVPSSRAGAECHNEPLEEEEVRQVFSAPLFSTDTGPGDQVSSSGYVTQLCLLFYVLLYEEVRLGLGHKTQVNMKQPLR